MDVADDRPVTLWISAVKAGDPDAARELWGSYFDRMARLAEIRLQAARYRGSVEDGEDAALSAFNSFCGGARRGLYPQLLGRDHLWGLLTTITLRKVSDQLKRGRALKRGGGRAVAVARPAQLAGDPDGAIDPIEQVESDAPAPDRAVIGDDEAHRLLDRLGDPTLRRIAVWRMEGYTVAEIAARLGCSLRTVNYKIMWIRMTLAGELGGRPGVRRRRPIPA